ncbi:MAG: CoA transferase [Elusimicrobia bacterium]|nr:CoA transferase [Elusimicrobiota bacterium]
MKSKISAPLSGIKVLDLSRILPGPFATMILSDLGAEVTSVVMPKMVDPLLAFFPEGPSQKFLLDTLYRGKKSVVLNFKKEEGRDLVLKMARSYDVFIEGFRAGSLQKIGLGYKDVAKVNPKIIYCSLSGYGQTGPYKNKASHDINYLAYSGLLSLMAPKEFSAGESPLNPVVERGPASTRGEPTGLVLGSGGKGDSPALNPYMAPRGQPPALLPLPVGDLGGGSLYAAMAIVAALYERARSGKGQYIDAAILDGILTWMIMPVAEYLAKDREIRQSCLLAGRDPFYQVYPTADGRYLAVGAVETAYRDRLLALLGREDLRPLMGDSSRWVELGAELKKIFLTKSLQEWRSLLEKDDVCVSPVLTLQEALANEQLLARGRVRVGSAPAILNPLSFSRSRAQTGRGPGQIGQHTKTVLRGLGLSAKKIKELKTTRVIL